MYRYTIIQTQNDWYTLPESPVLLSLVKKLKHKHLADRLFSYRQTLRELLHLLALNCKALYETDERCLIHTELHAEAIQDFTNRDARLEKIRHHLDKLMLQLEQLPWLTRAHLGHGCIKQTLQDLAAWRNHTHLKLIANQKQLEHRLVSQYQSDYQASEAAVARGESLPINATQPLLECYKWASPAWQSIYQSIQAKFTQLTQVANQLIASQVWQAKAEQALTPSRTPERHKSPSTSISFFAQLPISPKGYLKKRAAKGTQSLLETSLHTAIDSLRQANAQEQSEMNLRKVLTEITAYLFVLSPKRRLELAASLTGGLHKLQATACDNNLKLVLMARIEEVIERLNQQNQIDASMPQVARRLSFN